MALFQFDIDNKTLIIFMTSIIWAINFRSTFKNIDAHMDSGSYTSLKFENRLILVKNLFSCLFFIGFYFEIKLNKLKPKNEKKLVEIQRGSLLIFEEKDVNLNKEGIMNSIFLLHKLTTKKDKIFFCIKIIFLIIIIYFTEEAYFIISNNHILDRLICPIRNLGILISLYIFSPLIIKRSLVLYKHQFIPLIIIFILSMLIILYNAFTIERFDKIFGLNFIYYLVSFILMGLEMVLIKYLVDIEFISIFFILGLKGVIGTIVFLILNHIYSLVDFFILFDKILYFEYDEMYENFEIIPKVIYLISLLLLQFLKIIIINKFTEHHLLSVVMIVDIIYFPFYLIEKFYFQQFWISTPSTFYLNASLGFINVFLMLIFNEILECKFWGLDRNLKKNINKRQDDEINLGLKEMYSNSSITTDYDFKKIESDEI
jgi:hypothetical protein